MNLIENKKARRNYDVMQIFEAGLELFGHEVKSLRAHQGTLEGAHAIVRAGEAYIVGMSIPPFQPANTPEGYDPERSRKLLMLKKEIAALSGIEEQKGLTIVPLSVYNKGRKIKLSLGIGRGRKKFDKREILKKRDTQREIDRTLKNR